MLNGSLIRIRFSRHEALAVGKVQRLNLSGDKSTLSEKIDQPKSLTVSLDIRHVLHQTVFRRQKFSWFSFAVLLVPVRQSSLR